MVPTWLRASVLMTIVICHPHHEDHHEDHHTTIPRLIIVSLDGFRWDYLTIVKNQGLQTPHFDRMLKEGASVHGGLKNVFITKTFPNHYSMVTGRYADDHGIVGNKFFDPLFNESFEMSANDALDVKWWDGKSGISVEPIWKVNEGCGCKEACECEHRSGSIFWPGSEVNTMQPTYFLKYNVSMPFKDRVNTIVEWFTREEHPINFGLLYFHEPDDTGHAFGPLSTEVALKISELDDDLGYLLASLENNHLLNSTDLIISSDHGMLSQKDFVYLADYVDTTLFTVIVSSPVFHIIPHPGKLAEVYKALHLMENVDVYLKEDIPPEFHYRNNRRIPPIILSAHPRYGLCVSRESCFKNKGDHGYNNSLSSMHPVFVARGPSFKPDFILDSPVHSVDLYPLMAALLQLTPPPSDGQLQRVQPLLQSSSLLSSLQPEHLIFVIVTTLIVIVALVFSVCACHHHLKYFWPAKSSSVPLETSGKPANNSSESQKHLLIEDEDDEDDEVV